jgi:hypothetical protein
MRRALSCSIAAAMCALTLGAGRASADIYSYIDKNGVVHFTNIAPRSKGKGPWRKVLREAPSGKASARRGSCDRCDSVPATDRSREQFQHYDTSSGVGPLPIPSR